MTADELIHLAWRRRGGKHYRHSRHGMAGIYYRSETCSRGHLLCRCGATVEFSDLELFEAEASVRPMRTKTATRKALARERFIRERKDSARVSALRILAVMREEWSHRHDLPSG